MYANPNYGGGGGSLHHSPSVSARRGYTPSYTNQSGYSYSPGPPAGSDTQLWQWFTAVDTDRSGSISVNELQAALVNGQPTSSLILFRSCNSHIFLSQETGRVSVLNRIPALSLFHGPFLEILLSISILLTHLTSDFDLDTVKMLMNMFVSCPRTHQIEGYWLTSALIG